MAMTRRKVLNAMARLGGVGAAYETAHRMGVPASAAGDGGAGRAAEDLGRGPEGRDPRRRCRRTVRGLRARPGRLRLRDPGGRAPGRRAEPDLAARRPLQGDRHANAGMPLRRRAVPERRPGPHPAPPRPCHRLLPASSASRCSPMCSQAAPTSCTPATSATASTMQVRRALYDLQGHVAELLEQMREHAGHRPADRRRRTSKSCSTCWRCSAI